MVGIEASAGVTLCVPHQEEKHFHLARYVDRVEGFLLPRSTCCTEAEQRNSDWFSHAAATP